jgi:hypothetical protein
MGGRVEPCPLREEPTFFLRTVLSNLNYIISDVGYLMPLTAAQFQTKLIAKITASTGCIADFAKSAWDWNGHGDWDGHRYRLWDWDRDRYRNCCCQTKEKE